MSSFWASGSRASGTATATATAKPAVVTRVIYVPKDPSAKKLKPAPTKLVYPPGWGMTTTKLDRPPAPPPIPPLGRKPKRKSEDPPAPMPAKKARVASVAKPSRSPSASSSASSPAKSRRATPAAARSASSSKPGTPAPPFGSLEAPIPRPCGTQADGDVRPFSAADVVMKLYPSYKSYFENPNDPADRSFDPDAPGGPPTVELEYPNTGASEKFILLQPKDRDHYNPIFDLRSAIHTIIEYFLTPEQAAVFGTHPSQIVLPTDMNPFCHPSDPIPEPPSPPSSPGSSRAALPHGDLLRSISRAFNRRDGPLFVELVNTVSRLIRELKTSGPGGSNPLMDNVARWPGVHPKVCKVLIEQTYQRSVGPRIKEVKQYQAWTSNVYGELMPNFISDIVHYTGLKPGSHFLDLGCGVGNVVLQAALQSGCTAAGVENMAKPADLARSQLSQMQDRLRLWGLNMGDAEMIEGDFREVDLARHLQSADVVLVNNYAFDPQLNEELSRLFLDMKEGAVVVSLKSFVPHNFRLTQHNAETPIAILRAEEREFRPGTVSWSVKGGTYYVNHIDRSMLREFAEREASSPQRSTRGTRRHG